jgi:protein phosphatase
VKAIVAAATDIGKVRSGNEDSYLIEIPLVAVADGMGGHQGGEVASHLALETLETLFKHKRGTLSEQLTEANRAVFERSLRDPEVKGMGTTLTAAVADGDRLRLAHVGDSRAYLLRDGELRSLTEDHTLVREMEMRGELTADEAASHPHRSVLTRAIGTEPGVLVDEGIVDLVDGDRLLLCTDGLTGMVGDDRILAILRDTPDPTVAVRRLVAEANDNGGVDNVTAVVVDFVGEPGAPASSSAPAFRTADVPTSTMPEGADPPGPAVADTPESRGDRRSVPILRIVAWTAVVVLFVGAALAGTRAYLDAQWYVGTEDDRVALLRGVPSEVLGITLHEPVVVTTIPATAAQRLSFFGDLAEGIPVDSREAGEEIIAQIEHDLAESSDAQNPQATPGGQGGLGAGDTAGDDGGGANP